MCLDCETTMLSTLYIVVGCEDDEDEEVSVFPFGLHSGN
jgi:hypothetical protein